MLQFFRRIRQKLLVEESFRRYALYALGEILLVMIGILLALQVNNWNVENNRRNLEIKILNECKKGLEADLSDVRFNINIHRRSLNSLNLIIGILENDGDYHDSLAVHFHVGIHGLTRFVYSMGAYENMKSQGVDIISNEELRTSLITLFDGEYPYYLKAESNHNDELTYGIRHIKSNHFVEGFNYDLSLGPYSGQMVPKNFDQLKTDAEYLYFIKTLRNRTKIYLNHYLTNLRNHITRTLAEVSEEIILHEM